MWNCKKGSQRLSTNLEAGETSNKVKYLIKIQVEQSSMKLIKLAFSTYTFALKHIHSHMHIHMYTQYTCLHTSHTFLTGETRR